LTPEHHAGLLNCLAAASAHVSPSPDPQHASSLAFDTDGTIDIVVSDVVYDQQDGRHR
jgi:tRNA A37 threonylcarbamoyladenosine synthetase subunit TsaC/SUA5/YrdC